MVGIIHPTLKVPGEKSESQVLVESIIHNDELKPSLRDGIDCSLKPHE
jgi:hypothetical protein